MTFRQRVIFLLIELPAMLLTAVFAIGWWLGHAAWIVLTSRNPDDFQYPVGQ